MDRQSSTTKIDLERMLFDETAEPKALPLSLLGEITNGFCDQQKIGKGGFAVVYQGLLVNEKVAVKRLSNTFMHEKEFHREVECLMMVKHKNVVRFLGYCADTQGSMERYNGKYVMADVQQRLLCFEYLPKGSLDQYITDASRGLEWRNRYSIIKGICQGLHYLHQKKIVHLDLKPANILLNDDLVPKIADFGLSRCFHEMQSRAIVSNIGGTLGYLAPEFCNGEITYRFDIYSLGVIITEILTGKKGYHDIETVVQSWSNRLEKPQSDIQVVQLRVCAQIGIECTDFNPAKRPESTQHIIDRFHEIENMEEYTEAVGTTPEQTENAPIEWHQDRLKAPEETTSEDFSLSRSSNLLVHQKQPAHRAGAILLAVMKIGSILIDEATGAIIAKLSEKVTSLKELPEKFEQIQKQLKVFNNVIMQIDMAYLMDEVVNSWIGEVSNVAYHVEDVIDKCLYHVLQLQKEGFMKKFFTRKTNYVKNFREIMDDVAQVEREIHQVILLKEQWLWLQPSQLVAYPYLEMERKKYQDNFPEFFKDEDLVVIEENRTLLTGWLYSKEPENTVITVSGMGGLGKSTLVSNVYEREKIYFPAHAWIVVSQIYTIDSLLRKLLWMIGYTELPLSGVNRVIDTMDVYDLKMEIRQRIENTKCLIVLDDVWEQEVYFQIHDAVQNLQGSRIVITTRKDHVAGISSPTRHLEVEPLSQSDAFDLFCRRAFRNKKGHICPKDLEMIANAIVALCHGLPLAIVKIGSMLSSRQELHIWAQKYNQLRCELSNNDQVRSILYLSYNDLSLELQNCFLYCSLFAEDHPMSRDSLLRLWVAEGLVQHREKNTPEMAAERNLMELIHRNMLKVVENDELGRVKTCKMHAIVRELAISIAKGERFASANDYGTMIPTDKDVRRLSLCGWRDNVALKLQLPHLRTVVAVGIISYSRGMLSSMLTESKYLTVLELQDSDVTEVPELVGSLLNLRYIGLRRTKVKSLPDSIENLSNLQTLDIKQTKIEKLPRGIVKVKKLRHLLADRYDDEQQESPCSIGVQAPKELSNLEELQTLETVESSNDLAEQLKKLMQLRSLWIDNISGADCANLFATLSTMPLLSSLLLSAKDENEALNFEALKPRSTDLHRLIIRGQWAMGTLHCPIFHGHGKNLKYLSLSSCFLGEDPLAMPAPFLPNLTYLKLTNMHTANTLFISTDYFPHLKTLVLKHMRDVSALNISDGALPCIEDLYILSLWKLGKLPQGIESLRSLKRLWLLDLHNDFKWATIILRQKMMHVPDIRV